MPAPLILLEVSPRRVADGVVEKLYLAGFGGTTPYFYDGKHWRGGLSTLPALVNALNFANGEFGSGGVPTAGALVWAPQKDADRQLLSAYVWEDAEAIVRIGTEGALPAGVLGRITSTQSAPGSLTLFFADVSQTLKVSVLTDRYAGTGGIEGPAEWADRIKPRMFGRVWNVAGQPIDPANNVYAFADPTRPLQSFDAIRDKGAPVDPADLTLLAWQGSAAATFTALRNAVAPEGGGVLCPSIACVKWWTQPAGDLCVDLKGEIGAGYVESTAEIIERVVGIVGGPAMAAGTVAAAKAARPDPIGLAITQDGTTAAAVLDQYLGNVSLLWLIDAAGQIVIRQWAWGASAGSFTSHEAKRVETHRPTSTRKLGYKHNENVMARGDLAAIVLASDVTYGDGQTVEDLKPAQPGADVTGDNTSKDTEAVGGVPADTLLQDIDTATTAANQAAQAAAQAAQEASDAMDAVIVAQQDIIDQGAAIQAAQADIIANATSIQTVTNTVASQGASITVLQQAVTSNTGSIATLSTAVKAGNPNLLQNGGFENGLANWVQAAGNWGVNSGPNVAYGTHATCIPSGAGSFYLVSDGITAIPGKAYTVSGRCRLTGSGQGSYAYFDIIFANSSGTILPDPGNSPLYSPGAQFDDAGNRENHTFTAAAPATAAKVFVRAVGVSDGGITQVAFQQLKLEIGSVATPYTPEASVVQSFTAINTTAGQVATLQTTVSTQGGQISTLQQSVTTNTGAISTLQTTVGTQGSAITVLQQASTTQAGQIATLQTRVTAGSPNLLSNGGFENGLYGWSSTSTISVEQSSWAGRHLRIQTSASGFYINSPVVPADPNVAYTASADTNFQASTGVMGTRLIFLNSSGTEISRVISANRGGHNFDTSEAGRAANAVTALSPAGTVSMLFQVEWGGVSGLAYAGVRLVKMESGTTWSSYSSEASIVQSYTALSTTNTQLATLQTTVSTQGASITSNATAITTLQTQTATLTQQVTSGNPNLLTNGGFENGLSDWAADNSNWGLSNGGGWGNYAYTSTNPANGNYINLNHTRVSIDQYATYTLTADALLFVSGGTGGYYFQINWSNASDQFISASVGATRTNDVNFDSSGANRQFSKLTAAAPAGAAYARIYISCVKNSGTLTSFAVRQVKFERGNVATPYSNEASVNSVFSAISTANTQIASLQATVSTQGVTISQQQTAITTLNGNVATLLGRWGVEIDVNGYISGILLNNNGNRSDFTIRSDKFTIIAPGGGERTEYSNGNWRVYNAAGTLKVQWGINI